MADKILTEQISLKDLIRAVSDELIASRAERLADNRPAIFEVSELTIEASFVVTKSAGGGGGINIQVLRADANADYKQETVNRLSLKLTALKPDADHHILRELGDEVPLRPRLDEQSDNAA